MNRLIGLILITIILLPLSIFSSEDTISIQMKKFEPFIGKWKTRSIVPGRKLELSGDIQYRRILGKNWLLVEFVGQHPERDFWEAYVMIKFDVIKGLYVSHAFFSADDPTIMTGSWISDKTFGLEIKDKKGKSVSGINYTVKADGTIYQENWKIDDTNQRKITLKTYYTKK
jgi:hypothetical protein